MSTLAEPWPHNINASVLRQEKGAQTQTFGSGHLPVGWGLPREGVGVKKSVCSSKPKEIKNFGRISRNFGWDILGVPGKVEKMFVFNFWPV